MGIDGGLVWRELGGEVGTPPVEAAESRSTAPVDENMKGEGAP